MYLTGALTGNKDTDARIITSLKLTDLEQICRINKYTSNLCKNHIDVQYKIKNAEKLVARAITIINDRSKGLLLQTINEFETFNIFYNLSEKLNMPEPTEEGDDFQLYYKNYYIYSIRIIKSNVYSIIYELNDTVGKEFNPRGSFFILSQATEDQVQKYLMNVYYDETVF